MSGLPANGTPLLFDLDGTLVDSLPDLTTAANLLRDDLGLSPLTSREVRACVGDGARMLVQRALPPGMFADRHLNSFLTHYERHLADATALYPGIRELLASLAGRPLAVVTNKPIRLTLRLLAGLDLDRYFRVVIGGDSCAEKKPHPAPVLAALASLGHAAGGALMIGDHHTDLHAGRAAGTRTCFCTWGYGDDGSTPHDLRAENVAQLASLLGAA